MAVSIAAIAIKLITDTTKMVDGLRQAQTQLKAFKTSGEGAGKSLGGLFIAGGGIGAGIAVATSTIKLLSSALQLAVGEAGKLEERMAAVGMISKDDTLRSAWKEFSELLGAGALPVVRLLADGLRQVTELMRLTNPPAAALVKQLEAAEKAAEATKLRLAEQKKAAEEAARAQKALMDEGQRLRDSLRTPGERMDDEVANLRRLYQAAAIDAQTVGRAAQKIAMETKNAADQAFKFKQLMKPNAGAFEKGTSAEFSARTAANFEAKQQAEYAKQQAAHLAAIRVLEQKQLDQQQRIIDAVLTPQFQTGRF